MLTLLSDLSTPDLKAKQTFFLVSQRKNLPPSQFPLPSPQFPNEITEHHHTPYLKRLRNIKLHISQLLMAQNISIISCWTTNKVISFVQNFFNGELSISICICHADQVIGFIFCKFICSWYHPFLQFLQRQNAVFVLIKVGKIFFWRNTSFICGTLCERFFFSLMKHWFMNQGNTVRQRER